MMDPAVKTGLAICAITVGLLAATLFRGEKPAAPPNDPPPDDEVLLRFRDHTATTSPRETAQSGALNKASVSTRPAMVVTPLDRREPPPSLPAEFPVAERAASSRWGVSMEMMLPAADMTTTSHKIVDGDTLAALAERYLSSADRAKEIYELNRDVLRDPKLLPIGVELKLPPRGK